MGWLDGFTGRAAKRDLEGAYIENERRTSQAYSDANSHVDDAYAEAQGYYDPFVEGGVKGQKLYEDSIGVHGDDGYARAYDTYKSDPFLKDANENTQLAIRDTFRRYNAEGLGDSGVNRLATGRVAGEFARRDIDNFRNHLMRTGQTGYNASAAKANQARVYGDTKSNLALGRASTQNAARTGIANAVAQSRAVPWNNLMQVGGLAMKAVTPGIGGVSPAGNFLKGLSR